MRAKIGEIRKEGEVSILIVTDDQTLKSYAVQERMLDDYPESATYDPECTEDDWYGLRDQDRDVWMIRLVGGGLSFVHHPWQFNKVEARSVVGPCHLGG